MFNMPYLGVLVTSTSPVSVIGNCYSQMSSDAFVARPISQLGTQYMVATANSQPQMAGLVGPFVIAIVATVDNTQVTVQCNSPGSSMTLTSGALSCTKGHTMTLNLNQFQTAQVSDYYKCST
jgi:IgGFc binding protein